MRDVAHEQGVIERDAASRKTDRISEKGRDQSGNLEGSDLPLGDLESKSVKTSGTWVGRVTDAPAFEKAGRFVERIEGGAYRELLGFRGGYVDEGLAGISGLNSNRDGSLIIGNIKLRTVVNSREEPAPRQPIEAGIRIPPRNEHPRLGEAVRIVPFDGDAMGRILAGDTNEFRKESRPNALQSNETDAGDGVSTDQLRTEFGRKER